MTQGHALFVSFIVTPTGVRATGVATSEPFRERLMDDDPDSWRSFLALLHDGQLEYDERDTMPILLSVTRATSNY